MTWKPYLLAALLASAVCAPTSAALSEYAQKTLTAAEAQIGKHYWLRVPQQLCPTPSDQQLCPALSSGFIVTAATVDSLGFVWVRVRLDGSAREGWIRYYFPDTAAHSWATEDPEATRRASIEHLMQLRARTAERRAKYCTGSQLTIGATKEQAIRAWCFPDVVNSDETRRGISEQWVYRGRGYLYFGTSGRLVAIQRRPE